jgi:crossover junction endodeoxyribonuclease RusA
MIAFTVYGVARPKGSMRAFRRKGGGRPIITDGNRNVHTWQRQIAVAAATAAARVPFDARSQLFASPVHCEIRCFLPRPKAYLRPANRDRDVPHVGRPDLDKLTRAVLDALTHVLFDDDAQVIELIAVKRYANGASAARVEIAIRPAV